MKTKYSQLIPGKWYEDERFSNKISNCYFKFLEYQNNTVVFAINGYIHQGKYNKIQRPWSHDRQDFRKVDISEIAKFLPDGHEDLCEKELVSLKIIDLIDEAKNRYPVGTHFQPVHVKKPNEEYCIIMNENFKYFSSSNGIIKALTTNGNTCTRSKLQGNTLSERVVYRNGVWADIVTPLTEQVELGDYVEVMHGGFYGQKGTVIELKIENCCLETDEGHEFYVQKKLLKIINKNNNNNLKTENHEKNDRNTCKVSRFNFKIERTEPIRATSIRCADSKIRIGSEHCTD
jgi:ribosomal protein L24